MEKRESAGAVLHDRRRPGRRQVDPALIPLLRGQGPAIAEPEEAGILGAIPKHVRDDLSAAVGIARGVFAMSAVWAAGTVAYALS